MARLSTTKQRWFVADIAASAAGGYSTGIYGTATPLDIIYQMNHSETQVIIVDCQKQLNKMMRAAPGLCSVKEVRCRCHCETECVLLLTLNTPQIIVLYKPDEEPRGLDAHRDEDKLTEPIKIREMIESGEQADIGVTIDDIEKNSAWAKEVAEGKHIHYWDDLMALVDTPANKEKLQKEVHHREVQVKVDDCYTLIYTSGTTGR